MVHESTVYTSYSKPNDNSKLKQCPHCSHTFDPGELTGEIFCTACGKKFPIESTSTQNTSPPDLDTEEPALADIQAQVTTTSNLNKSIRAGKHSRFGDYIILEEVARGGMGVVYKAQHKMLKRVVALKVIKSADDASADDIKRFIQEAKSAAILKHPNIVPIHNFDVYRGLHFFTMDFIDGTPLDRIIEKGPIPPYKACELIRTIAESISYAHSQGVIHRDIKPGNVIIDREGRPMLTDFGLAINLTSKDEEDRMTKSGAIMGTIPYIAPEQAEGKVEDIGPLSDIYSLGALFYELISGKPPFHGLTQFELLKQIINHYPPSPKKLIPRLNKDLDTIIMKCIAKEPERRYQTAADLAADCTAFLHGDIIQARPLSLFHRLHRKIMRRPGISLMLGSLILISIFSILLINYAQGTTQQLLESQAIQEKINKDKNILGAMLKRDWRGEYGLSFTQEAKLTTRISESQRDKIGWYNPQRSRLDSAGLTLFSGKNSAKIVAFGAPSNLPQIFHVSFKVFIPELNMGKVQIYLGLNKSFDINDNTKIIELGVEGSPGAKISKGDSVLAEDGSFTLSANKTHNITVYSDIQNKVIIVQADGKEVIRVNNSSDNSSNTDTYTGIAAVNGEFTLKSLQISVLGMNQEMIRSSLRLADSLAVESKDQEAARVLYKKILKERSDRSTLLRAYSGYIRTLGSNERNIIYECNNLADSINQSHSRFLEIGEIDYLTGIALAARNNLHAGDYFKQSFNHAYRNALKDITPSEIKICGGFNAKDSPTPQELFSNTQLKGKMWSTIAVTEEYTGNINLSESTDTAPGTYYIKQKYKDKEPRQVIIYLDNNTDRLFINQIEFKEFLEDVGRNRRYAITELPAGENTLILEHTLTSPDTKEEVQFRVRDHNLKFTTVYGLLSRVEEALLTLKLSPDSAVKQITTLQNDKTLEYLKEYYSPEIKARGILQAILNAVDKLLNLPSKFSTHAWILLEAARTLSDPSDGSELALRYNKLAESLVQIGNLTQANDLFTQAITLQPDWYTPLLKRAELLYRQEDLWYEGVSAMDEALKKLPNSLELRLQIAQFYLQPGYELAPDPTKKLQPIPERALKVAEEAVTLSKRNSAEALTLCARALEYMKKYKDALHYIQEAILLENSSERSDILDRINHQIAAK